MGDAKAKPIHVTDGIVANWRLLLDDQNAEQLSLLRVRICQSVPVSIHDNTTAMAMATDRSSRGQNLAGVDIHDKY